MELLTTIEARGAYFALESDGGLVLRDGRGIPADLVVSAKQHKAKIVAHLRRRFSCNNLVLRIERAGALLYLGADHRLNAKGDLSQDLAAELERKRPAVTTYLSELASLQGLELGQPRLQPQPEYCSREQREAFLRQSAQISLEGADAFYQSLDLSWRRAWEEIQAMAEASGATPWTAYRYSAVLMREQRKVA